MNQNKCVFCSRSDVGLILLGSGLACSSCLTLAHDLVNAEGFSPDNKVEEGLLSLIFFLETDLVLTRQLLKSQSLCGDLDALVRQRREKLIAIEVDYNEVKEPYIKKINNLIKQHLLLLDLYTDFP